MPQVCVFPGEDAAPEAMEPTLDLLDELDTEIAYTKPDMSPYLDELREDTVPDELRDTIEAADTVLFGSGNVTHVPILWYLRRSYRGGNPLNVRPVRYIEGGPSPLANPEGIDYEILRECHQGVYFRAEGDISDLAPKAADIEGDGGRLVDLGEGKYGLRITTDEHTRRFAKLACDYVESQVADPDNTRFTVATKSNVLRQTDGLFQDILESTAAKYGFEIEHLHTDDMAQRLVTDPHRFDYIATPNFAGDLLSDGGVGAVGGLGLAPSACYGEEGAYFEPVHGTAPDIVGENIINPTATILSAVMMLDFFGYGGEAERLRDAVESVYAAGGPLTPDQGGDATTTEFAAAVSERL